MACPTIPFDPARFLILVVDDTNANLKVLGEMLDGAGYDTTFASSGGRAIERVEKAQPDLVLLDLMMPDVDGLAVCDRLQARADLREIPVIFLTASRDRQHLQQAFAAGAVDYVTKPFNPSELLARVRTHLELKAARDDLKGALQALQSARARAIDTEKQAGLGKMAAGMAHELNNANNILYGNLHFLQDYFEAFQGASAALPEAIRTDLVKTFDLHQPLTESLSFLAAARRDSDRIRTIVAHLKRFSRLGEAPIKSLDLNEALERILSLLQSRCANGIVVRSEYGAIPTVECEVAAIEQSLFNLLDNAFDAVEATGRGGEIHLRTWFEKNDWVGFSIRDRGIGFAPGTSDRLFAPFFTTKEPGCSSGLGLTACYQAIVVRHGGRLECRVPPDGGAEFVVRLPRIYSQQRERPDARAIGTS